MTDPLDAHRVSPADLRAEWPPDQLPFDTTEELPTLDAVFGQERAVRAIEFALGMSAPGYHLYAAGPDGIGKATITESFLRRRAQSMTPPPDWVYVHNFDDPDRPIGISMRSGEGRRFAEAVRKTVETARAELQHAFESDSYARQRTEVGKAMEQRRNALLEELRQDAERIGFMLQMTPTGITSAPLLDGKPLTEEQFHALPEDRQHEVEEHARQLEGRVQEAMLALRALERESQEQLRTLDGQVATFAVEHLFEPLIDEYHADAEVAQFLQHVRDDIQERHEDQRNQPAAPVPGLPIAAAPDRPPRRYEVNVLITNDPQRGAPVIVEPHPTYHNLLGRIEYIGQFGTMATDHTLIKAGSLARANGGFLLLRLRDLLTNAQVYDGLKRALATEQLVIENLGESLGLVPTSALKPEPIPLDLKVVIVGDSGLYSYLYRMDPDFRELFRVKADFETEVPRRDDTVLGLAALIHNQCERSGLRCFSDTAVARLVEHSSRLVEDQRKLSANMGAFVDIVRQADFWAGQAGATVVGPQHVERALEEQAYRSALVRDRVQEMIADGTIFIDTHGMRVGQVNALSVLDLGDLQFGRPSRITCITSAGTGSIVNVERESDMAGRIHNKGFLILRGFIAGRFGQARAMSLHASLTFEQLYGDIDGDSASSTEIYALLSSLAEAPIRQSIAVTGSVNQLGEVQPIGGATAKIEGFFDVCRAGGLDGTQGVMIPRANVRNVVLRPEVAAAVAAGQFHVWAVSTIDEGIELLTGIPAGVPGDDGEYPEGTIFRRAADRLTSFRDVHAPRNGMSGTRGGTPQTPPPESPPGVPPPPPPEPPIQVHRP